MTFVKGALKAFYAAAVAAGTSLVTVLIDDASIGDLTDGQWVVLALGALVAFGGTYGITNVVAPKAKAK